MNILKNASILKFAVIAIDNLAGKIADERITLETLVSVGIDSQGNVELRWVDYPATLADKVAIPIHRTPGYRYFASIQKLPTWDFQIVEGETEVLRDERMAEVARILTQALPVNGKNRVKEVFDLHLVTPTKGMTIGSMKAADNGKAQPLFTGTDADQFRYPRLASQGLFAAKGNQLVFFAAKTVFEAKAEHARNVHTLPEQIDYLNRVHLGQQSIVATTAKGMNYVLKVADVIRTNQQAKISAQAELGARFVGTPGGNGLEFSLEIGSQGKDQVLTIWPKASKHAQQIVSAAC
ncbi:MAG TPA: hypothetical protein VN397_03855 [Candidatus Methylomirabilis sp.]|nr:hypothetical protein [Candidatus Methylomirabilis sp.]